MREAWKQRIKDRRKLIHQILRSPRLSHHCKILKLTEQKRKMQRWLCCCPFKVLMDINVLVEIPYVMKDIKRINAKIAKIKYAEQRLQKWEEENPNHPFYRRNSHIM